MYRALEILDKSFRPSGHGGKSPAAYTLFEVRQSSILFYRIVQFMYIIEFL